MQQQRIRSDEEDEVEKVIEEPIKNLNEHDETKGTYEKPSIRCSRIDTNFSGRICWSNLELESILEPQPQEEAKDNNTKTDDTKTKQLESKLAEKDTLIDTMKKDLNTSKSLKAKTEKSLAESEKVVEQLKVEIQRIKDSEKRLYDSFVTQTSELEQAMIFIDKWKDKMSHVEESKGITSYEENSWLRLQVDTLENELRSQRKGQNPWEEVKRLRKELDSALEAEVNSKRAMDDLAVVIKEVSYEAKEAKEKLTSVEQQRDLMKEALDNLKSMMDIKDKAHQLALTDAKNAEEKNLLALLEVKKESESLKATINRLKIEVKQSLPHLTTEYVDSIKKAEDEKVNIQEEKKKLVESLNEAKDESRNLREILMQAKVEIAQLKDSLAEKEITQENDKLKRPIPTYSKKDEKEQKKNKKESYESKGGGKLFGDLKGSGKSTRDLKSCGRSGSFCSLPTPIPGMSSKHKEVQEEHAPDDFLTDSIFDIGQPPSNTTKHHHTRSASAIIYTDDSSSINSEDYDISERSQIDDMEIEKGSQPKKKVLLKKFSELWRRKSNSNSNSNSNSHNYSQSQIT